MTQVDFYILSDQAPGNRHALACRLANKAWREGHRVYLHTNSAEESQHLDKLLWTLHEDSFLPHGLLDSSDPRLNPVLIGNGENTGEEHDVLVNLATQVPTFFSRFQRVAEIIDHDPEIRNAGRERFRFYRDRGYPLNTHDIKK